MKISFALFLFLFISVSFAGVEDGIEPVNNAEAPTTNAPNPKKRPKPAYMDPKVEHPLGARPDCSQKKVSAKKFPRKDFTARMSVEKKWSSLAEAKIIFS